MTINKSQGQSVEHVGVDLRTPVFSHGQLYVALSREPQLQASRSYFQKTLTTLRISTLYTQKSSLFLDKMCDI